VREPAGNLPADVTSFVGRRREITLTKRLLAESRLVTLTGPGGVGKTRLALRVAGNMRRAFKDKAWLVELEELRDPELLTEAVVEQLGLGGSGGGDEIDNVVEHLREREMLLVLDNCEHVLDEVAQLADAIVRWCPGVRILATSRQSLGISGEATMVVPPLQVPDIEHLPSPEAYEQYASVRLFADRAKAAVPDFEIDERNGPALMRLCHHLDGNPLAIELAAVRLRALTPQQLEERLGERYELLTEGRRTAPARQQTLRALIDWSWELCSERDQRAWARMCLFSGSFDLPAAEHVARDGLSRPEVLNALHSLVDQSVLLREQDGDQVRFRLLHAMREYGQERLAESGEQQVVQQRHCEWYSGMVERFSGEWIGPEQVAWMRRLHLEQGNLRVALQMLGTDPDHARQALRMATRLSPYWAIRGLNREARHWTEMALPSTPEDAPERVPALRISAWFALLEGDPDNAEEALDEASRLVAEQGDPVEDAYLAHTRGMAALMRGQFDVAEPLLDDALRAFTEHGSLVGELFARFGLGLARGLGDDPEGGVKLLERGVEITAGYGELFWRSYSLWATAHVEMVRGVLDRAEAAAKDALRLQRELDNRLGMAFAVDTLAWIAERHQRHERAARLFGASAALWESVWATPRFYSPVQAVHAEHEDRARRALGDQAYRDAHARGNALSPAAAADLALEVKRHGRSSSRDNVHPMPVTRRERQIAEQVAEGRTNKEIAENLVIAQRTVEGHVQNILTKLDFSSRAQIAGWVAGQKGKPAENQ
jgi:non-specific serine/threonine protein kinase